MASFERPRLVVTLDHQQQDHLRLRELYRQAAIQKMRALGSARDAQTLQTLLSYMQQYNNLLLRPLAASRLGEIADPSIIPALLKQLQHVEVELRILAAQVLGEIGDPSVTDVLALVLQADRSRDVRLRAALALGNIGGTNAVAALHDALRNERQRKVRHAIIEAIGKAGDARSVPVLIQIMQRSGDKETRTYAIEALGAIGAASSSEPLVQLLRDQQQPAIVRYYAALALGNISTQTVVSALRQTTQDSSRWVAYAANAALQQLGHIP